MMLDVKRMGTCSIITEAYRQGTITDKEAFEVLDESVKVRFRIDTMLCCGILTGLGFHPFDQKLERPELHTVQESEMFVRPCIEHLCVH